MEHCRTARDLAQRCLSACRAALVRLLAPCVIVSLASAQFVTPDASRGTSPSADPRLAQYTALERALTRYSVLAGDSIQAPLLRGGTVRPGDSLADAPALRTFLAALGDLPQEATTDFRSALYDSALVAAVVHFQERHGLETDGVIGPATKAQLRVPLSKRVEQIALTMVHWRQMPDPLPERVVMVNIPEFRLRYYENDPEGASPLLTMKVIVGQARDRFHTPVFNATMEEVVLRPYWDVPLRIARRELLPIIRRTPNYLTREHMDVVRGGERDARVYPPTGTNLAQVEAGTLRLRQRPGPWNALGLLKFDFPNPHTVYMHGTPEQTLFNAARRDLSHGCIRVEDPLALGAAVLRNQAGWERAAIDSAMHGVETRHVRLERPVRVVIFYATVVVDSVGMPSFYPDLYGVDAKLGRSLAAPAVAAAPAGECQRQ